MREFRNPRDVHPPLAGYTHQVEIGRGERLLLMSGQVGMTPDGVVPPDALDQLDLALENVRRNLTEAGLGVEDLVKLTLYLAEEIGADARARVLEAKLGGHRPCMTLVYVARLASPRLKVEVDAWASRR